MIALILHKEIVQGTKYVGFSICEIGFSLFKAIRSIDRFERIFHQGSPSINKIINIHHLWGREVFVNGLNNGKYLMNKETIVINEKDIIDKLFKLSLEYKNQY